ncbi:hypothetical protein IJD44_07605 [bacterium]|nr:hypothetical protein [bacterium]
MNRKMIRTVDVKLTSEELSVFSLFKDKNTSGNDRAKEIVEKMKDCKYVHLMIRGKLTDGSFFTFVDVIVPIKQVEYLNNKLYEFVTVTKDKSALYYSEIEDTFVNVNCIGKAQITIVATKNELIET